MRPEIEIPEECLEKLILRQLSPKREYRISDEIPQVGDPMIDIGRLEAGQCQHVDIENGEVEFNWPDWDGVYNSACAIGKARKLVVIVPEVDVNQIKESLNE